MTDPARRLTPVIRLAPAKVNLTLAVIGRRSDGFHELHSVMVPLGLADRLSVAISPAAEDSLFVRGDAGPTADNLVLRAFAAARAVVGRDWAGGSAPGGFGSGGPAAAPALAARLEKAIPVAAGLAGGSTDAAAAVDAALEAWGAELDEDRRRVLAASLGSDVPFFLARGAAAVEGRGERVTPLPALRGGPPGILLVTPAIPVSTPLVFAAFDAGARRGDSGSTRRTSLHLAEEWRTGLDARRLFDRAAVLAPANDLLAATAAVAPEVVQVRRALMRLLGRPVGQSGSGPTCWVLYPSLADAIAAAGRVTGAVERGELPRPGGARPFVHATTIETAGMSVADRTPTETPPAGAGSAFEPRGPQQHGGPPDMTRDAVKTSSAPAAIGPYSQGIGSDGLLFCSGQIGLDPATGNLVEGLEAQTERVLQNIAAILDAAGLTMADVVKTTIFLTNMADFVTVNAIYAKHVVDPPPARSTLAVAGLPKGAVIEIEAIARRRS